jgi:amino acid adenylation domain-containing protein
MLAAWRAGAYFIPLNTRWPESMLAGVLGHCKPDLVLCHKNGAYHGANAAYIEQVLSSGAEAAVSWPNTTPSDLAYVIYTSGSTGTPKGVMIQHSAYASYIEWTRQYFAPHAENRGLLISAELTFDITMGDLAFALSFGTEVHVAPDPGNIVALYRMIVERSIDTFYSVPTTHNALFHFAKRKRGADLSGLKLILSGGDYFGIELIEAIAIQSPRAHFYNVYGPTEMTINCFAARMDTQYEHVRTKARIPIGKPFSSIDFVLLDEEGRAVPNGAKGRLCVAGPQTMLGYLDDPEATKRAFVRDPRVSERERLLYDTGDIGVLEDDGQVYLYGRADRQVKIKGYRIHPDEITRVARAHEAVVEAATIATDEQDSRILLIVTSSEGSAIREDLLNYLRARLPHYMVPAVIEVVDRMPLNNSGKIDTLALKYAHRP